MDFRHCCGCWSSLVQSFHSRRRTGGRYRKIAKYNEKEYTIEFENLIEEEDFYAPPQHAVSQVERDLVAQGKFDELIKFQSKLNQQQDDMLRQKEEDAMLEDEAYIQAKKEASLASRQQLLRKKLLKNTNSFKSEGFSKWLSKDNDNVEELDIEDFDNFLEKVKTKSGSKKISDDAMFEQTLTHSVRATKLAGDALNALQPVELHAVSYDNGKGENSIEDEELIVNNSIDITKIERKNNSKLETTRVQINKQPPSVSVLDNAVTAIVSVEEPSVGGTKESFLLREEEEDGVDDNDDFVSANSQDGCFEELLV